MGKLLINVLKKLNVVTIRLNVIKRKTKLVAVQGCIIANAAKVEKTAVSLVLINGVANKEQFVEKLKVNV